MRPCGRGLGPRRALHQSVLHQHLFLALGLRGNSSRRGPEREEGGRTRLEGERLPQLVLLPRGRPPYLGQMRDRNLPHLPPELHLPRRGRAHVDQSFPLHRRGLRRPRQQQLQPGRRRRHARLGVGVRPAELQRARPHFDLPT